MLDKLIKKGKIFIVAEIGVNHEGDVLKALEMITLAKKSGADAVKFQTYLAESYVSSSQEERLERVKRFQLNFGQFRELSERAKEEGVIFFSTPLDLESLELLNRISSVIKVSSGDINNYPFLKEIASLKKPVILSTGLSGEAEITRAIDALKEGNGSIVSDEKLILLHCVSAYPAPEGEVNLLSIPFMMERFGTPVGYSDHTKGILACEAACALGACLIEKHFTYKKEGQAFQDHHLSADPVEFKKMAENIRRIERMRGSYKKEAMPSEVPFKIHIRRSVAALRDLNPGDVISEKDICFLRPETGIPVNEFSFVLGKTPNIKIQKGNIITRESLKDADKK